MPTGIVPSPPQLACRPYSGQPSGIPGNIGILKSKVMVWDHDPFWARPTQCYSWPFSQATETQMKRSTSESDVQFQAGGAFLTPVYKTHDMFVCTLNSGLNSQSTVKYSQETTKNNEVDFVGSVESGVGAIARIKMPPDGKIFLCDGGRNSVEGDCQNPGPCYECINRQLTNVADVTTGKSIFPHQVWKHVGSLLDKTIIIHPSEYSLPLSELQQAQNSNFSMEKLQSAPKWDYIEVTENGKSSIWPMMITKQSPDLRNSVHWTLEKWTPVWQGQDFFVTIRLGDKRTDDAVDPKDNSLLSLAAPYSPYFKYNISNDFANGIGNGVTNEAFYVAPRRDSTDPSLAQQEALKSERAAYDWRYKTYILIEIGVGHTNHNYFIELVKGRNPRFLHFGEEWDNVKRTEQGVDADADSDTGGFAWVRKCRCLQVYNGVSCDQLFRQRDIRITVRNHLGYIVITFDGYEDNPWVISRLDADPTKTTFEKRLIPMVVPSAPIRIHGGNISCAVNYSPLQYLPAGLVTFTNRQVDTGPDDLVTRARDRDIYLTFSHIGASIVDENSYVRERYFDDERFKYDKVGYDCDAYDVVEKHENSDMLISIYEQYERQYRRYGKGWYNKTPRQVEEPWNVERDPITLLALPPKLKNGMKGDGGVPSSLRILNARNPSQSFPLTLDEDTAGNYEWKDYVAQWDVGIELKAGSVVIKEPSGNESLPIDADGIGNVKFENCVTPIATSWRLIVLGGGKPIDGNVEPFDISPLVAKVNDSWSSEDFFSISHEMQMECYIPLEATVSYNPVNASQDQINLYNLGRTLLKLHDKAFYLTVSYWWENGIGHRWVESNILNQAGDDPNNNDVLIQMTGVAYGAELHRSNNRLFMSFNIKDYMSVLENQYIFNSPFFDCVKDVHALYELAKLAGFADSSTPEFGIDRRPLGYLRKVMDDADRIGEDEFLYNGEKSRCERYNLPGSYASLASPAVKFDNGETYESAMKLIAQLSGKAIYFDRWGVLRLETLPAVSAAFLSANERIHFTPVFDFVSTPLVRETNIPDSGDSDNDFEFDYRYHAAHLVYNSLTYQRSVEDCANQIILLSASNDIRLSDGSSTGGFVIEGYTFFDQLWHPDSEGFIGYRKPFYQANGVFGSIEGVRSGIAQYARMKYPPVIMSFETYGVPGLKALDIITLDGNLAYIREITHELDPEANRWWMNIQAEWLKPFKGELGFLETTEPTTGG